MLVFIRLFYQKGEYGEVILIAQSLTTIKKGEVMTAAGITKRSDQYEFKNSARATPKVKLSPSPVVVIANTLCFLSLIGVMLRRKGLLVVSFASS